MLLRGSPVLWYLLSVLSLHLRINMLKPDDVSLAMVAYRY